MAWVETRITRTTQPQDACGIDWSNPLAQGLVSSFIPGLSDRDFVSGSVSTYEGGQKTRSVTEVGVNTKTNPTRVRTNSLPQFTNDLSFLWLGSVNAFAGGTTGQLFNQRSAYTDGGLTLGLALFDTSSIQFNAKAGSNGELTVTQSSVGFGLNQIRPIAGTLNGTSQKLFVDGVLRGSRTNTVTLVNQTVPVYIGALSTGTEALNANHAVLHIWNRGLSDDEVKSISENPWQIFEPEVSRIWVDDYVSAGGGTTTVTTDASATYTIAGAAQSDRAAQYQISSVVTADAAASYAVRGSTAIDASAAYAVASAVQADASASYVIASAVQQDAAAQYAIRGAVTTDASASYSLISATSVTADASASYVVQGSATLDAEASYAVRAAVFADAVASYALIVDGQVTADASAQYQIRGAVQSDASLAYEIAGAVQASAAGGYVVQTAVSADAAAGYVVRGAVVVDVGASYLVDGVAIVLQPSIHNAYVPLPRNQAYVPLAANQAYVPTPTNQAYLP